jgi:hypothetical protein
MTEKNALSVLQHNATADVFFLGGGGISLKKNWKSLSKSKSE